MSEQAVLTPEQAFHRLKGAFDRVQKHLRLLECDYGLIEDGYEVILAVDFHEMYRYAYTATEDPNSWAHAPLPRDEELKKHVARVGLFYATQTNARRVLLPPHVVELNSHMLSEQANLVQTSASAARLLGWIEEFDELAADDTVRGCLEEYRKTEQISQEGAVALRRYLESNIGDVLYLMAGLAKDRVNAYRELLLGRPNEKPSVLTASSLWPDTRLRALVRRVLEADKSPWYDRFQAVRKHKRANELDAKAVDLVFELNRKLAPKGQLVFMVSDVGSMVKALTTRESSETARDLPSDVVWGEDGACFDHPALAEPIPVFRPLEVYYYHLLMQDDSREKMLGHVDTEVISMKPLDALEKEVKQLSELCDLCDSPTENVDCEHREACEDLREQLEEQYRDYESLENVRLAAQRFDVIAAHYNAIVARQRHAETRLSNAAISFVELLQNRRPHLEASLENRMRELTREIDDDLRAAVRSAAAVSEAYQQDLSSGLGTFTRTTYRVKFRDEGIATALGELEEARYSGSAEQTLTALDWLLEMTTTIERGPERWLLWCVMLLSCKVYETAIEIARRLLNSDESDFEAEFLYIRDLARYHSGDYSGAISGCQSSVKQRKHASDARFHHLRGLAMARWEEEQPDECPHSWDDSLRSFREAHRLSAGEDGDEFLHASVTNNLAYVLLLRRREADLAECLDLARQLEKPPQGGRVLPEVLHTIGCVHWWAAKSENSPGRQDEHAERALENLRNALTFGEKSQVGERRLTFYRESLADAEKELTPLMANLR